MTEKLSKRCFELEQITDIEFTSQGTQAGVSNEIWSSEKALPIDKRIELKNLLEGSSYNQMTKKQKHGNVVLPPNWMQQRLVNYAFSFPGRRNFSHDVLS